MKTILYITSFAIALSCGSNTKNDQSEMTAEPVALEQETGKPLQEPSAMPVGEINTYDLKTDFHADWYNSRFEAFQPDAETLAVIEDNIEDYEIKVFMGTWCPDSRREVPKLFKILDEVGYDLDKVTMYGVDRRKTTPDHLEQTYAIKRVPTIIFFKNGEEVNRIVEYPRETLEKDIAAIITGEEYSHSYAN
ncbi:MAG TPA: thioredoxin family protein [Salinimicrobium sp.]|nr:thioredoxin family protein [Salinimicrobium sp.]